jgi:hypothetical protein
MSRNPKSHPAGHAPFDDIDLGDGPVADVYVKHSDTQPPVPGRSRNPVIGPCDESAYPARNVDNRPRATAELQNGVRGVPSRGSDGGGPSAAYASLSYEQRQARARRGR